MTELERTLVQLGRELDYPPTPAFESRLAARAPAPRRATARPGWRRPVVLALAALLLLAGAAFAAVPGVRDAVLEALGLEGATVERRERLPVAPELRPLRLGEREPSVVAAAERLGFTPLVPAAAGRPDGVFVRDDVPGGELSLTYAARPGLPEAAPTGLGLLVTEFRGDFAPEYVGKIAGAATSLERLRVDGERAIWVEGAPHLFFYRPPDSDFAERRLRLAANVLLLEQGPLLVRLEGAFGRERALALARSLRPLT